MRLLLQAALLTAAFTAAASAQVFSIAAPQDFLRVGEAMQLTPLLRSPGGAVINPKEWVWSATNPDVATVDSAGNVTANKLGYGEIRVSAPAEATTFFGSLVIQVQPKNVTVAPATQTIQLGQKIQFTATFTDINDQPVPAPGVSWFLTVEDGRDSLVPYNVAIGADGSFTGGTAGIYTVHANLFYPIQYGKASHFEALAQAIVTPPASYSLTRLVSSDPVTARSLRPAPGFFAGGDSGNFVFSASADGLSTAAVGLAGTTATVLLGTGTPNPQPGGVVAGFQEAAVNSRGDSLVAVRAGDVSNGALLATPTGADPRYVLLDNSNGVDQNNAPIYQMTFLHLTRYSLNDNGNAVVPALYFPQDGTARDARNGLFLLRNVTAQTQNAALIPLLLFSEDQKLDSTVPLAGSPPRFTFAEDDTEVAGAGWSGIRGFGIDNNDNVYFMAQAGAARGLFQVRVGGGLKKILSVGDTFPGSTSKVRSIQDLIVTPAGDLVLTVSLQNNEVHLTFFKAGTLAVSDMVALGTPNPRIMAASSTTVVFEGIPAGLTAANQKDGLYTWKPPAKTATPALLLDANTKYISSAFINSGGGIVAVAQTSTNGFILAQPGGSNLFTSGAAPAFSTYISFTNIVHGLRSAQPSMLVSSPGSLFDLDGAGNTIARVVTGDSGFEGTDRIVEDPSGVQYYASSGNLYRYTGGRATSIVAPKFKASDNVLITPERAWSANAQGAVLFEAGTNAADGHRRLYMWRANVLTLILSLQTSTLNGHKVINWVEAALDDNGRAAMVVVEDDGNKELITYDGKTTSTVLNTRTSSLNNEHVANFDHLRGASGGYWIRVALSGDFRLVDANSKGDIVLAGTVDTTGTQILLFRGADGKVKIICANNQQLPTGDYIARFSDVNLRDDGTVYFLAFDVSDRALVFAASPL